MVIDPLTVKCPKERCEAPVWQPCIRVAGPYGVGTPLRKMHKERFVEARRVIVRQRQAQREAQHKAIRKAGKKR